MGIGKMIGNAVDNALHQYEEREYEKHHQELEEKRAQWEREWKNAEERRAKRDEEKLRELLEVEYAKIQKRKEEERISAATHKVSSVRLSLDRDKFIAQVHEFGSKACIKPGFALKIEELTWQSTEADIEPKPYDWRMYMAYYHRLCDVRRVERQFFNDPEIAKIIEDYDQRRKAMIEELNEDKARREARVKVLKSQHQQSMTAKVADAAKKTEAGAKKSGIPKGCGLGCLVFVILIVLLALLSTMFG